MKKGLIVFVVLILIIVGFYFFTKDSPSGDDVRDDDTEVVDEGEESEEDEQDEEEETEEVIGTSVEGRDITAHHFGDGDTKLLFVGGIHGGYSWNTALLAYELIDYLTEDSERVPRSVSVAVVPVLNPDGLESVVGTNGRFEESDVDASEAERIAGRFNANSVDLNRNFDCDWAPESKWRDRTVSGGDEAFSEPEAKAIRDFIDDYKPHGVVVWYSSAGGVFASNCREGVLSETTEITNVYADASGYKAFEEFNFYEITGDMVNWLAKEGIPAISVLLTEPDSVEWSKNRAGIEALFDFYTAG